MLDEATRLVGHPMTFALQQNTSFLRHVPGFRDFCNRLKKSCDPIFEFFRRQVEEHKETVDWNSAPTDFVDAFLREMAQKDESNYFS